MQIEKKMEDMKLLRKDQILLFFFSVLLFT